MDKTQRIPIPGTGQFIEVPPSLVEIGGTQIEVPGKLPVQFCAIAVAGAAHWLSDDYGPRLDPDGQVFLGRAIRQVGEALFGADWNGQEFAVNRTLMPLPARPLADYQSKLVPLGDKIAALELLGKGKPPRRSHWDTLLPEQWARAQALREQALDYVRPARARVDAVMGELERALCQGVLISRLQSVNGGATGGPRPAADWLVPTETLWSRMVTCRMNSVKPFDTTFPLTEWIFVDQEGLKRLLVDIRKRTVKAEDDDKPKPSMVHRERYVLRVRDAVRSNPTGPVLRDELIREGREIYRLPAKESEVAYKEGVDTAAVPHNWSKPGRKSA